MKDEAIMKRKIAEIFRLSQDECDLVNRIVLEEILAGSKDTHEFVQRTLDRFAGTEGERRAFLAGHITGWVLMKADMDMDIDAYFADSRDRGPEGRNT